MPVPQRLIRLKVLKTISRLNSAASVSSMLADKKLNPVQTQRAIAAFMDKSSDELPLLFLLEALASCPYLIKAAISEARGAPGASASDLAEIEAALSLLKVPGWREGEGVHDRLVVTGFKTRPVSR